MSDTAERARRHRWLLLAVSVLVVVAVAIGAGLFTAYRNLDANLSTIDSGEGLGDVRPEKENQSINVLVIGSDSREGENSIVGGESPGLSDTTLLIHLAADNSWAAAVSVPRDSMVQMPECLADDGTTVPAEFRQFNEAYRLGGPVCVQRTMESLTGLLIDHFVVVDFAGFTAMVDAIGGVAVYIDEPISDPRSGIYFDVGCQTLAGKEALDYVRVRHGVGTSNGSDIDRIKRQQAFLSSMAQKVTSTGVLLSPIELYRFLDAATESVTTDTELGSIRDMASLAVRVRAIGLGSIDFTTVPNEPWPPDPNRVQWVQPDADELWARLREDVPLSGPAPGDSAAPSVPAADPTDPSGPTASPAAPPASPPGPTQPPASTAPATASPPAAGASSSASPFDTRSADGAICPPA